MKTGKDSDLTVSRAEEQAVRKSPESRGADIFEPHRKLLWVGRYPLNLDIQFLPEARAEAR